MKGNRPILLVEDDTSSQLLLRRALTSLHIGNPLHVADNGEEALQWLKSIGEKDRPCIILMDLNMPRMNGFELLKVLREDNSLRIIPVVVMTTSKEKGEIMRIYELGISGYMVKPVDYQQFVEMIKTIDGYWTLCEQPD